MGTVYYKILMFFYRTNVIPMSTYESRSLNTLSIKLKIGTRRYT